MWHETHFFGTKCICASLQNRNPPLRGAVAVRHNARQFFFEIVLDSVFVDIADAGHRDGAGLDAVAVGVAAADDEFDRDDAVRQYVLAGYCRPFSYGTRVSTVYFMPATCGKAPMARGVAHVAASMSSKRSLPFSVMT